MQTATPQNIELDDDVPTDDEISLGFYKFSDLVALGIVRDRTDLHRKQRAYGFPRPMKTGDRQAPFLKIRVHNWVRQRAALSRRQN